MISLGAGRFPGAPSHSFGDGLARLAWLFVNGDTLVENGVTYPITGPVPDLGVVNGISFVRTNLTMFANGPRGAIQLRFPTGFSLGLSDSVQLSIGRLGFGERILNAQLEPQERVLSFNAPVFGVEETKPFWIAAPRLEWRLNDRQIVLSNPTGLVFLRQTEDDILESSRGTLTQPNEADRISNDGYYRGARLGPGDVTVRADAQGAAW